MGRNQSDILVLINYDVKPINQESYNMWNAGNGHVGEDGWLLGKGVCIVIKKDVNGYYYIDNVGTSF